MNEDVRQNIIGILDTVAEVLSRNSYEGLKELSYHAIRIASIYQDDDSLSIALLVYAFSKIMERHAVNRPDALIERIANAKFSLKNLSLDQYHKHISTLFRMILRIDTQLSEYIQVIFDKAKITKGSTMISQGLSVERVASLLGISQWELMSYVGKTTMVDEEKPISSIKERIKLARSIFS